MFCNKIISVNQFDNDIVDTITLITQNFGGRESSSAISFINLKKN